MTDSINKDCIVEYLLRSYPTTLDKSRAMQIVDLFFAQIAAALVSGDRIELRGFCSMVVRVRAEKTLPNPKTKKKMDIPERGYLYFRPSKILTDLLKLDPSALNCDD
ncbi:Integration host factor beta-subunit [Alphaproteobacteria bacterium]